MKYLVPVRRGNQDRPKTLFPRRLAVLLICAGGAVLVLFLTRLSGVGISPDSIGHISVARNLHDSGRPIVYNQIPLVDFPIGYPAFLWLVRTISGIDPVRFGAVLNAVLFTGLITASAWFVRSASWAVRILVPLAVLFSPGLIEVYTMLWSETLFILMTAGFIFLAGRYIEHQRKQDLFWLALCAGIACIVRYAGVSLILTGAAVIFFSNGLKPAIRFGRASVFALLASLPLATNLLFNTLVVHSLTGQREKSITSLAKNLHYTGDVLTLWLSGLKWAYVLSIFVAALIWALALLFCIRAFQRRQGIQAACSAVLCGYVFFIVFSATFSRYETINNRLLSPAFVPLILTAGFAAGQAIHGKWARFLLPAAAVLFFFGQYLGVRAKFGEVKNYGVEGYSDDFWKRSKTVKFLRDSFAVFRPGQAIYSNANEAVYFFTGRTVTSLPHLSDKGDVRDFYFNPSHYVIWFETIDDLDLPNLDYIRKTKVVRTLFSAPDGQVLYCTLPDSVRHSAAFREDSLRQLKKIPTATKK